MTPYIQTHLAGVCSGLTDWSDVQLNYCTITNIRLEHYYTSRFASFGGGSRTGAAASNTLSSSSASVFIRYGCATVLHT